jgi:2-aminoadipate transaminase
MAFSFQKLYSTCTSHAKRSEIRELLKLTTRPEVISFAGGLPSPESFPIAEIEKIASQVVRESGASALQYGPTEGDPKLRKELVKWLAKDGIVVDEEQILITNGSQQGLDLVGKIFLDIGDPIVLELPSYIGGLQAFNSYQATMYGVLQDDEGMRMDLLEEKLKELKAKGIIPKFIYIVPDFQNPSGVTMPTERRIRLLELAKEYQTAVIEDSPYRELRFEGQQPEPIIKLDEDDRVITMGTFSKIFCPGLRLAWIVGPHEVISKMVVAKQSMDLCTAPFTQAIAAKFMEMGLLHKQIDIIKELYYRKRQVMLKALEDYMPEGVTWTRPEGGLFLWVRVPEHIDSVEMFPEAVANNVAYVVGSAFHCDGGGRNTMRLNFSYPTEKQIVEGIKRLAAAIKKKTPAPVAK